MLHQLHVTEGLILSQQDFGEANRLYYVLTAQFGRVLALAQSVRKLKSKLRGHLIEHGLATFVLVRGREFWRIVGASESQANADVVAVKKLSAQLCRLLLRLVRGEEKHEELFAIVREGWRFLQTSRMTAEELTIFETVLVLRILDSLGYISGHPDFATVLGSADWPRDLLSQPPECQISMVGAINQALSASML